MSAAPAALPCSTPPRVATVPHYDLTHGPLASAFAGGVGLVADDWQKLVLAGGMGELDGRWSASQVGCWVPRQNGKGSIIEMLVFYHMFILGTRNIVWSAHNYDVVGKAFRRFLSLIDRSPTLKALVKDVKRGNGQQAVYLHNGVTLTFNTRSNAGLRGVADVGLLVLDEAQELTIEHMAAVTPILGAATMQAPGVQVWLFGTPPRRPDAWCYTIRRRGMRGADRVAWFDWGLDLPRGENGLVAEHDLANRSHWHAANPALGVRISEQFLDDELGLLGQSFSSEHLGVWPEEVAAASRAVDPDQWRALRRPAPLPVLDARDEPWLAIDAWGDRWAVARCFESAEGVVAVEVALEGADLSVGVRAAAELADRLDARKLLFDGYGVLSSYATDLKRAFPRSHELKYSAVVSAWSRFAGEAAAGRLVHAGDPLLDAAVDGAATRKVGDRLALDRTKSVGPVHVLLAASLASWGVLSGSTGGASIE